MLAAVKVTALRPERASNQVRPSDPEPGSGDRWKEGVEGQLSPSVVGDLNALAGTMPNVTMTPAGASILGSGSESNLTTLNGMGLASGSIPRAASTETRVTGATFDATRGGFAGANIDVRLGPGDRIYQRRNAFITFDPPSLQITDPVSRALGTTSGGFRGSVGADGELIRRALTYNVALDVSRAASAPSTLVSADADALLRAGVAPDSVARLIAIATPARHPARGRRRSVGSRALGDHVARAARRHARHAPDACADDDRRRDARWRDRLRAARGAGRGGRATRADARLAAHTRRVRGTGPSRTHGVALRRQRCANGGRALSRPAIGERAGALRARRERRTTSRISCWAARRVATTDDRWTLEASNETGWNANGRRHRFKAMAWGRVDGLRQEGANNALGSYTFNSLADFAANRASSYSRTLSQPDRSGTVWNAATAFVHTWAPSRFLGVIYGARLEGDGFTQRAAEQRGARAGARRANGRRAEPRAREPARRILVHVQPRPRERERHASRATVGRFYRTQTGTLRGGIGEFRDLLRPGLLADASASSGLPGGTLTLSCVGTAVPQPDWSSFDAGTSPTQCLDGSGVLAERAPSVTLIDPGYDVPRSWRSSLDWSQNMRSWLVRVGGMASYDLNQPGAVDANFSGEQRFTLAADGGRPVYVSAASIDPTTGAVSASESRRSAEFGRVVSRVSDLRGYGGQLTLRVVARRLQVPHEAQHLRVAELHAPGEPPAISRLRRRGLRRSARRRMGAESERRAPRRRADRRHAAATSSAC